MYAIRVNKNTANQVQSKAQLACSDSDLIGFFIGDNRMGNTKRCSKCKEIKPLSDFYKKAAKKDGRTCACKSCLRLYCQSEKGKATHNRYEQSEKGETNKKRCAKRYRLKFPYKNKANKAVQKAIKDGRLPPPKSLNCSCNEPAQEYHHHKGYEPKHWLDVVPVCVKCHKIAHRMC
ncbi:MAG: hypothetical protein V3U75_04125 [Methylococcaceae bacterium]